MIEPLRLIQITGDENDYTRYQNGSSYTYTPKEVVVGYRYPDNKALFEKINEIIDYLNKKENE